MQFVFDFIDNISGLLDYPLMFFLGLIDVLTRIYTFIEQVEQTIVELIFTFPFWLQGFALGTVAIAIIYQILHFTQGGSKSDG